MVDTINNFSRSDGTVTGIAAAWALTTLDPQWRELYPNSELILPFDFEANRRKVMILMSDGGSAHLVFPRDTDLENSTELPLFAHRTDARVLNSGEQNTAQQRTCDHIKSKDVEIFTVGFQIRNENHAANLRSCASASVNAFDAVEGNLNDSFDAIAGQVGITRLSR